jgi:hypothetical protein
MIAFEIKPGRALEQVITTSVPSLFVSEALAQRLPEEDSNLKLMHN